MELKKSGKTPGGRNYQVHEGGGRQRTLVSDGTTVHLKSSGMGGTVKEVYRAGVAGGVTPVKKGPTERVKTMSNPITGGTTHVCPACKRFVSAATAKKIK